MTGYCFVTDKGLKMERGIDVYTTVQKVFIPFFTFYYVFWGFFCKQEWKIIHLFNSHTGFYQTDIKFNSATVMSKINFQKIISYISNTVLYKNKNQL